MRMIGVLGGMSWPSTVLPYRLLNEDVQQRLGGHHSARVVLYSIDYDAIKTRYHDGWAEIPGLLLGEIETLLAFRPDCWMMANNTLHKAYDRIVDRVSGKVPFFHAVELVRDEVRARGLQRVLLLGTRFTMEDGFFAAPMQRAGITVTIPDEGERATIQAMQTRLARGEMDAAFAPAFAAILKRYEDAGCQAAITACTELPLVITQELTAMAVIDPLVLQCRACVDFALAG